MSFAPVFMSDDLRRIFNLPRRTWTDEAAKALAEAWSPELLNPYGRSLWDRAMRMHPAAREAEFQRLADLGTPIRLVDVQATSLYEFVQMGGAFIGALPGTGKTLISLLACTLANLHWGIHRVLLVVMASGRDQTHSDFSKLCTVWRAPVLPQVETYAQIGQPGNGYFLCGCDKCRKGAEDDGSIVDGAGLRPQLTILDESDMVRNEQSAVHRRVHRLHDNHPTPEIRHMSMTGTPMRHTMRNFRRPMIWALGPNAPVPYDYLTTDAICSAIDNKPKNGMRRDPGVLRQLIVGDVPEGEGLLDAIRDGYGRRISETPGVIITTKASTSTPVNIRIIQAPDDPVLEQEFYRYASTGTTPDGWLLADPLSRTRYETELSAGYYSAYDPRPPEEWTTKRKAWLRFVKEAIDRSQRSPPALDSEKEVAKRYKHSPVYIEWKEIQSIYDPKKHQVCIEVSRSVLTFAVQWIRLNSPALIWVQQTWTGEMLSMLSGVPFYGGKGKTTGGDYICDQNGSQSAILSAHANRRQRNLQAWQRNLIVAPEHSDERLEQQISRTSRRNQKHAVSIDFLVSANASIKALESAVQEAHNVRSTFRMPQKILGSAWTWDTEPWVKDPDSLPLNDPRRARWCRH